MRDWLSDRPISILILLTGLWLTVLQIGDATIAIGSCASELDPATFDRELPMGWRVLAPVLLADECRRPGTAIADGVADRKEAAGIREDPGAETPF